MAFKQLLLKQGQAEGQRTSNKKEIFSKELPEILNVTETETQEVASSSGTKGDLTQREHRVSLREQVYYKITDDWCFHTPGKPGFSLHFLRYLSGTKIHCPRGFCFLCFVCVLFFIFIFCKFQIHQVLTLKINRKILSVGIKNNMKLTVTFTKLA